MNNQKYTAEELGLALEHPTVVILALAAAEKFFGREMEFVNNPAHMATLLHNVMAGFHDNNISNEDAMRIFVKLGEFYAKVRERLSTMTPEDLRRTEQEMVAEFGSISNTGSTRGLFNKPIRES